MIKWIISERSYWLFERNCLTVLSICKHRNLSGAYRGHSGIDESTALKCISLVRKENRTNICIAFRVSTYARARPPAYVFFVRMKVHFVCANASGSRNGDLANNTAWGERACTNRLPKPLRLVCYAGNVFDCMLQDRSIECPLQKLIPRFIRCAGNRGNFA